VSEPIRFRLDDVRRHATELAAGVGLPPARAAVLASHLLWFDAAGASSFGIATLPRWLERLAVREFDLTAEGKVGTERNGTAVLDGQNGVPPLILERAAGLAIEKARDAGIGLVRVTPLGPTGPAAVLTAEMAIGPMVAAILGPGPCWSLALPSGQRLPAVFDSALATATATPVWPEFLAPWVTVLAPGGGWLVLAVAVTAWESLPQFHERVEAALGHPGAEPGQILPADWEAHRREVREHGLSLPRATAEEFLRWAERLGVAPLAPAHADAHAHPHPHPERPGPVAPLRSHAP
jgi:LDH2 family malate/lactate/ureidoglycolate dehydrogenase